MTIFRKIGKKLFYRGGIFCPTKGYHPSLKWEKDLKLAIKEGGRVINVGAGEYHRPGVISIDPGYKEEDEFRIKAFGENLPFKDNSIDFVICNGVLAHVKEPVKIVNEIYRVLKPGGRAYIATVFLYPFHPAPNDYNRMTLDGLEYLCRKFERLESGICLGPSSTIARILVGYSQIFFKNRFLKRIAKNLTKIIVSPLKYFDKLLINNKEAANLAGGVYFYGKKKI